VGCALAAQKKFGHNHIIISAAEHPAVENSARRLEQEYQFEVTRVPVDTQGFPQASAIEAAIRPSTALCSFLLANNEVGTISPLKNLAMLCKRKNPEVIVHTDGVQAAAWTLLDFSDLGSDIITIGGHKFGAPGGGALIARQQVPLMSWTVGGGHENGLRAGTPNVPEILALVRALEVRREKLQLGTDNITALRDSLVRGVLEGIVGVTLTGHPTQRLPNLASFVFEGLEGNTLARMLDFKGFAVSPGAACKTGNPAPSAVLTALGFSKDLAMGGLRISLGFETSADDISALLQILPEVVDRARASLR
jgi:cysteine desulfurase